MKIGRLEIPELEEAREGSPLEPLYGAWSCQHLELRLLASRSRENETPGEHPEWSRISTVVREATGKGSGARLFVVKSLDFSLQIEEYCSWIRGSCDWDQKGQSKKK